MRRTHTPRAAVAVAGALALAMAIPVGAGAAEPPENMPQFGYQGEITVPHEMLYENPSNEFIFPSVFHAGAHLDDPLGEWYLYTAPHDAPGSIIMMYADSLEGPWTEYSAEPVINRVWEPHHSVSHVSSPDAVWNPELDAMVVYYHGENSTTRWATSTDGLNFTYGGIAVNNQSAPTPTTETSYARVFEHPDPASEYSWAMFYMANEPDNRRKIRLAESYDGMAWTVAPDYVVVPGEAEGANVSSANLWEWQGQLYVIYHASSGKIHARQIDRTLRNVAEESFILHESSGIGDDRGRTAAPEIITHNGETYLFYEGGHRLGATIRWAKDGADVVIPPPFGGFPVDYENPVFEQCAAEGSDDFTGDALDRAVWDRIVREDGDRHRIEDGTLIIPTYQTGVAGAPLIQQELPEGSWQVTTKLTINPQATFQQAGLLLYTADNHYAKFDLARATPGRSVELVYAAPGVSTRTQQNPPRVFQDEIWLRLTSDGTIIRAFASYDGVVFDPYGYDISVANAGFTHVGPFAFRGNTSAPEIEATFDWFRFSPDADSYAECMDDGTGVVIDELEQAIADARAIDTDGYTAASVASLQQAIAEAEAAVETATTQEQIDAALAALLAAIDGLEEDVTPTPTPTPDPEPTPEPTPDPSDPPVDGDESPRIWASTTQVRPGDTITVDVADMPGAQVEIGIASEYQVLATATLTDGAATVSVTIPADISPGTHHLQARNADGELLAEFALVVLSTDGALSDTGASGYIASALAALLLLGGGAALVRRRRHALA